MNEIQVRALVECGALRNGTRITATHPRLDTSEQIRPPDVKSFLLNRVAIRQPDNTLYFVCCEQGSSANVWIEAGRILAVDGMDVYRTLDSFGLIPRPPGTRRRRKVVPSVEKIEDEAAEAGELTDG